MEDSLDLNNYYYDDDDDGALVLDNTEPGLSSTAAAPNTMSGRSGTKRQRGDASGTNNGSNTGSGSAAAAAASRKKKKEKVQDLEQRVAELEKQNIELKLQLKLGVETQKRDEQEKKELTKQLDDLIKSEASKEDFQKLLLTYVKKFADYGEDRTRIITRHMKQLENLLMPTQVTKMCMWALHQDDDFYKPDQDVDGGAQENIWSIVMKVIDATEEQKEKIKLHREDSRKMAKDLRFTIRECEDLGKRMRRKNMALAEEMKELRKILSPIQMAKFILWVNKNKTSMAMLDKLWSPNDELKKKSTGDQFDATVE